MKPEKVLVLGAGGAMGRYLVPYLAEKGCKVDGVESRTWGEIAAYYKDICNLKAVWVDKEDYLAILTPNPYNLRFRWQLEYARLFDREVDNSKVLAVTGLKQEGMMPLYDGLKMEIGRTPRDYEWQNNQRMDDYLAALER
jgi:hypothetical protein